MTSFSSKKKETNECLGDFENDLYKQLLKDINTRNSINKIKKSQKEKGSIFSKKHSFSSGIKSRHESFSINSSNIKSLFSEQHEKTIKVFSLIDKNLPNKKDETEIKLRLSDYEESNFFQGKNIIITNKGLENGFRLQKDGYVFFGTCKEYKGIIINDYIINTENQNIRRYFVIFYKDNSYYFKANLDKEDIERENLYTYIKISKIKYPISNTRKNFFQIGTCLFNTEINKNDNSIKIEINTVKYRKTYHFYPSEVNVIMIGRDEKNIICVNEKLVSKWHCNIYYEALEKKWFIVDGYLNKNSTNGTWKFCNEKVQLINQTDYIKIGKSIIEINKVN